MAGELAPARACGGLSRSAPTGGCAKGTPRNCRTSCNPRCVRSARVRGDGGSCAELAGLRACGARTGALGAMKPWTGPVVVLITRASCAWLVKPWYRALKSARTDAHTPLPGPEKRPQTRPLRRLCASQLALLWVLQPCDGGGTEQHVSLVHSGPQCKRHADALQWLKSTATQRTRRPLELQPQQRNKSGQALQCRPVQRDGPFARVGAAECEQVVRRRSQEGHVAPLTRCVWRRRDGRWRGGEANARSPHLLYARRPREMPEKLAISTQTSSTASWPPAATAAHTHTHQGRTMVAPTVPPWLGRAAGAGGTAPSAAWYGPLRRTPRARWRAVAGAPPRLVPSWCRVVSAERTEKAKAPPRRHAPTVEHHAVHRRHAAICGVTRGLRQQRVPLGRAQEQCPAAGAYLSHPGVLRLQRHRGSSSGIMRRPRHGTCAHLDVHDLGRQRRAWRAAAEQEGIAGPVCAGDLCRE